MSVNVKSDTYHQRLAATRARFIMTLPERLDAIATQVSVKDDPEDRETAVHKLHRLLHELAGNSAMLDMTDVSSVARKALEIVEHIDHAQRPVAPNEQCEVLQIVAEARLLSEAHLLEVTGE